MVGCCCFIDSFTFLLILQSILEFLRGSEGDGVFCGDGVFVYSSGQFTFWCSFSLVCAKGSYCLYNIPVFVVFITDDFINDATFVLITCFVLWVYHRLQFCCHIDPEKVIFHLVLVQL